MCIVAIAGTFGRVVIANAQTAKPTTEPATVAATGSAPSIPAPVIAPVNGTVDAFQWMTGCWQAKSAHDGATINETWPSPCGGSQMGIG